VPLFQEQLMQIAIDVAGFTGWPSFPGRHALERWPSSPSSTGSLTEHLR
jgi:hypothetical protein